MVYRNCIIAAMMREEAKGGAATHIRTVRSFLSDRMDAVEVVSPFQAPIYFVYPVFAMRMILTSLSRAAGAWWHQHIHYLLLRHALWRRLRQQHSPTVVYAQCPLAAKAALETCASGDKVALVIHFNDSQADEMVLSGAIKKGGRFYWSIRNRESETLSRVDLLIFLSDYMRRRTLERIPAAGAVPNVVIPNFVERHCCRPSEHKGDLISLGLLVPRKNNEFALHVLHECARLGHRFVLSIVGDGPERPRLEALARKLGIQEYVCFYGHCADPYPLLASHRVLVHPSKLDNMPYALLEALSCSLPIIAAPVGGVPEVLREGLNGFFWDLSDVAASAQILIRLMTSRELYDRLCEGARQTYESKFSAQSVSSQFLAALAEADAATPLLAPTADAN